MNAIEIISSAIAPGLDPELVARSLRDQGFDVIQRHENGELSFVAIVRGPEFHFASAGTGSSLSRKAIREFLRPIIKEHGFAQTKTPVGDFRQRRFNESLGFKSIHEDKEYITYRIKEVKRCQSSPSPAR